MATALYMWVRQLAHYAEVKNPGTYVQYFIPLAKKLERILRNNGQMAVVQYLKLSLFALYSYISGNPLKSTIKLGFGIRLRNGLPSSWSRELRKAVRESSLRQIRLLASLCNMYKAMEAPHPDFDVSTISAPHPELEGTPVFEEYKKFCKYIFPSLLRGLQCPTEFKYRSAKGLMVRSAGANVSGPAMTGIVLDAQAWANAPVNLVKTWFEIHGDKDMLSLLQHIEREHHWSASTRRLPWDPIGFLKREPRKFSKWSNEAATMAGFCVASRIPIKVHEAGEGVDPRLTILPGAEAPQPILGRLHAIPEPAGKVRVVAICDYWTQAALKPVHDYLFDILKRIPNDGTFDQEGRTQEYFLKGLSPHWSFDLKAATDTIPLALYKECLGPLLRKKEERIEKGYERSALWARILTERDFLLPDSSGFVRYNTGQPMGALSSWASMALVHHSLVQFAHYRATRSQKWFQDYLVLGDDIDIASSVAVSNGYREVCSAFSIIIGILKSLSSLKNVFEFANQRFCPDGNISPISLKEEISSTHSWATRLEYAKRILTRFGSNSKDLAISLVKKASTVAQWAVLSGELSHLRPSTLLSLTRFCLLNPFGSKEPENYRIDVVLKWLALALPKEDADVLIAISKSPSQLVELQSLLVKALLTALERRLTDLIARTPRAFSVEFRSEDNQLITYKNWKKLDCGPFPGRIMPLIRACSGFLPLGHEVSDTFRSDQARTKYFDLLKGRTETFSSKFKVKHATMGILYLMACIEDTNLRILKLAKELLPRVRSALRNLASDVAIDDRPDLVKGLGESYLSPFQNAIALWIEGCSVPDPIIVDLASESSQWLGTMSDELLTARDPLSLTTRGLAPRVEDLEESLRAPLGILREVLLAHLDLSIPDLPYLKYRKPGGWTRALSNWLMNHWRKQQTLLKPLHSSIATIGGHGGICLTSVGYADGGVPISLKEFRKDISRENRVIPYTVLRYRGRPFRR